MEIIINDLARSRIDRRLLKRLADRVSRKKWIVSISFVRKEKMKQLNRTYRRKNRPTDVLSFSMKEGSLLGDVIICPAVARSNARKYKISYQSEIGRLAVHGLLHLLGHDHGKRMFDLQDRILKEVHYA